MALFASHPLPKYQYSTLDPWQKTIRLVRLLRPEPACLPGAYGTLRIELLEVHVDTEAPYDALSYAWGDPGSIGARDRRIVVRTEGGSRELLVYRPLELALLHLAADSSVKLPLFIDQISINQDDKLEKSHQVRLMRDIYARCSRTVVWLGPATRASRLYFDYAREVCSEGVLSRVMGPRVGTFKHVFDAVMDPAIEVDEEQREDRDDLLDLIQRFGHRFPLQGFADVLDRRWFNRLWIIQEACLAPTVVFVCGRQSLCFDCFRGGALFYTIYNTHWAGRRTGAAPQHEVRRRDAIFSKMAGLTRIWQERKTIHHTGRREGLYGLVLKFNVNNEHVKIGAGLAEDRIFGLLGLAAEDDGLWRRIRIRYADEAVQIYTEVAALLIEENMDVLLFAQFPKQTQGLPSWVPDWAMNLGVPVGYASLRDAVFAAGGAKEGARCRFDERSGRLTVRGVSVDSVVCIGQRTHRSDPEQRVMEDIDYRWANKFFEETVKFAGQAAASRDGPGDEAETRTALRLCDSGLSHKHFAESLGARAGLERLGRLHSSIGLVGQRLLDSDERIASFHITRIYRTLGITPWYWTPASEMASLRICARDPAAAGFVLCLALVDFLVDMVGLAVAAARVGWASYHIKLRRRFAKVQLRPMTEEVMAVGLDPGSAMGPDKAVLDANILKNAGRRLYRTERGYVGVGPAHMAVGDSVVVLHGGTVPHLLRRGEGEDETWKYLGEVYCDGIMKGEALEEAACIERSFILA